MIRRAALVLALAALVRAARADDATTIASGLHFDPASVYQVPLGDAPSEGPADAPITIVDWSDYACGYCNRVQPTLDRLARLYPGQIRWVHRALPLDDEDALPIEAARAAAAQGRFRPMHDRLYALHGQVDRAGLELIARELGLDMLRFRADLDAGTYRASIAKDLDDARALGVTGTPMFFINGRPIHGSQSLDVFAGVVDEELARAKELAAQHPADLYAAAIAGGKTTADTPELPGPSPELDPATTYRVGLGLPGQQEGPDDALVTIVEWSDFQCPFCAREAPVLAQIRAKYGADVRIIYRFYPVRVHPDAMIAAEAGAAAAAQGRFWAYHDQVFAHFGHLARDDLEGFARAAGLDLAEFRAALDSRRYHDEVLAEAASGEALGVDGTPTLFVNGRPVVGAASEPQLDRIVHAELDRVRRALDHGIARADIYALVMADATGEERADPSTVPEATHVEMRADERARAVDAACRRRDAARATVLARALPADVRRRVAELCAGEGVDLP